MVYEGNPGRPLVRRGRGARPQLAPLRMASGGDSDDEPLLANLEFTDLMNLGDAATVDTKRTWRPRSQAERLRVPIGVGDVRPARDARPEGSRPGGMGPHGLCVGATGSGKSELLRTWCSVSR
ncbi:hypothetical protein [Streptomyces sp. KL116D]|uniref:hypothetical protein n=1 Tax=Streptomyces sp. KL116D TaxID=3045152 RepID=UPI0035587AC3